MKHLLLSVFILIGLSLNGFAQKEEDNWFFGWEEAVNFASGNPVIVNGSAMAANYGSTSLSDSLGNLLFYSDGQEVYNRLNLRMPHGDSLLSSGIATSPCIGFRMPGSLKKYFLFTVAGAPTTKWKPSVNYSVIDMSLDGGLGDIVAFQKNVPLLAADSAYQTIGAVRHGSLDAYWVFVRNHGTPNKMYAFLVDVTGVHTTPVVSLSYLNFNVVANGQSEIIKISPDGKYLLYAARNSPSGHYGKVELYAVDNLTGQLTQILLFDTGTMNMGAEFSANSEFLFMSNTIWSMSLEMYISEIRQYDLKKINDVTQFQNYAYPMVEDTSDWFYGNQLLANNGKIYFIHSLGDYGTQISYLGVINYPYLQGAASNIQLQAIQLINASMEGLPTFVSSYAALFDWTGNCVADSVSFHSHFYPPPSSFLWNFGDPSSGSANTSNLANPRHVYYAAGEYTVTVTAVFPNGTAETATRKITVSAGPNIEIGDTLYVCPGDSIPLTPGSGFSEYLWSNGSQASTIYAKNTGVYWVRVRNQGDCASIDSVLILNFSAITLYSDSIVISPTTCNANTGAITGLNVQGLPPFSYTWKNGGGTIVGHDLDLFHLPVNNYTLWVTDSAGCITPSKMYTIKNVGDSLILSVDHSDAHCSKPDGTITVNATAGLTNMLFYALDTNNFLSNKGLFTHLSPGSYQVWVKDSLGCKKVYDGNPVIILNSPGPSVEPPVVVDETEGQGNGNISIVTVSLSDSVWYSVNGNIQLNNGNFSNLSAGSYSCKVSDKYGCDTVFNVTIQNITIIHLQAIAGDGSACLGNVAVLPLLANSFSHVSSFDSRLKYNKSLVTCQNYLNANPALADSLRVDLFPTLGELSLTWTGKNPVNLPDGSTLVELSFASLMSGQDSLKWDISPGICTFLDSLGNRITPEFKQGQVRVYSIPEADIAGSDNVCEGSELQLMALYHPGSGNGTISYLWNGPAGFSGHNPLITISPATAANAGQYSLLVSDTNQCQGSYSVAVSIIPTPVSGFPGDTLFFDETRTLEATPGYDRYTWSSGDSTYSVLVTAEGWFKVTLQTAEGCIATDSVMMLYAFVPLSMPNAFTPDGDGLNDEFRPVTVPEKISSFSMYIYDKWGKMLFFTSDFSHCWDGTINGTPAPLGVYSYTLTYGNPSGEKRKKMGLVTLVR